MHLQLQQAGDASPAAGQHEQQQQQQLVAVADSSSRTPEDNTASTEAVVAAPPAESAAAESAAASDEVVLQLREALAAAEDHVCVLTDEAERLMELSNGLRAENEGLKRALVGLQQQQKGGQQVCACV